MPLIYLVSKALSQVLLLLSQQSECIKKKPVIYKSGVLAWLSYIIKLGILFFHAQRKFLKVKQETQWYPRALKEWDRDLVIISDKNLGLFNNY